MTAGHGRRESRAGATGRDPRQSTARTPGSPRGIFSTEPYGNQPSLCARHRKQPEKKLSNADLTSVLFILLLVVGLAQLLGHFFVRLQQPKVVGEILAGIVLGPSLVGRLPFAPLSRTTVLQAGTLNFVLLAWFAAADVFVGCGDPPIIHSRGTP